MKMDLAPYKAQAQHYLDILVGWLSSPQFYAQVIAIIAAVLIARIAAKQILAKLWLFNADPVEGKLLAIGNCSIPAVIYCDRF